MIAGAVSPKPTKKENESIAVFPHQSAAPSSLKPSKKSEGSLGGGWLGGPQRDQRKRTNLKRLKELASRSLSDPLLIFRGHLQPRESLLGLLFVVSGPMRTPVQGRRDSPDWLSSTCTENKAALVSAKRGRAEAFKMHTAMPRIMVSCAMSVKEVAVWTDVHHPAKKDTKIENNSPKENFGLHSCASKEQPPPPKSPSSLIRIASVRLHHTRLGAYIRAHTHTQKPSQTSAQGYCPPDQGSPHLERTGSSWGWQR